MSVAAFPTSLPRVDDQTGAEVRRRRMAIGMDVKALAEHAGVDRGRLAVLEKGGNVRLTTVSAVLRALDELEHEMGMDVPSVVEAPASPAAEDKPLRFVFHDVFGIGEIIAEGPVDHPEELVAAIRELLADIRTTPKD